MSCTKPRPALLRRRAFLVLGGAVAAIAAAPALAAPKVYSVTIRQMAFGPTPPSVRPGDIVEWVNADIFRHTATARDGSFDLDLPPGARARTVMHRPGAVSFYCRYHPSMTGRLAVAK